MIRLSSILHPLSSWAAAGRWLCLLVAGTWLLPAVVLALCLFGSAQSLQTYGTVGAWLREIGFTFRDAETQWMLYACLAVYFVTFLVLSRRQVGRATPCAPLLPASTPLTPALSPSDGERVASRRERGFWSLRNADLWLAVGLVIATLAYAFSYSSASKSTEALMLLGGIVLGKAASVWARWVGRVTPCAPPGRSSRPVLRSSAAEGGGNEAQTEKSAIRNPQSAIGRGRDFERRTGAVITILTLLLLLACLWQAEEMHQFQYRGQARWNGPWDNPNIFGMLMGVGVVLAVGQAIFRKGNIQHSTFNIQRRTWKCGVRQWIATAFFLAAGMVMSFGLVKSYSRGAWLATAIGLAYLTYQALSRQIRGIRGQKRTETHLTQNPHPQPLSHPMGEGCVGPGGEGDFHSRDLRVSRFTSFLRRNWLPLSVVLLSVVLLAFWNYRHTDRTVARRAFSVGNVNDFSWRNRVAAWEGAWQIMAEKPWLGVGWNQPQQLYDKYYLAPKLSESAAIQMNDYLMLGMTLGIPVLACFVAYIALSLTHRAERKADTSPRPSPQSGEGVSSIATSPDLSPVTCHLSPRTICRSAALVLLVAFFFDGGLFKLATGSTFWILLELGRED